jgi:hypothetical protein
VVSAPPSASAAGGKRRAASVGLFATAVVFAAATLAGAHGCVDDRDRVANDVFFCDPTSRTADADCGPGYRCYSAVQSLGGSICVPRCDPQDPGSCKGACTANGACLMRCGVPAGDGGIDYCPSPLVCRRTTVSSLEAAEAPDGVCLPVSASCTVSKDCRSPVFDECTSDVNGASQSGGRLLASGEVCVQGKCSQRGIACQPGSACIRDILPATIPVPDVCAPICSSARFRAADGSFNECLPGMTCLSDAFPQIDAPACTPGFPGWLCVDDLGCTTGTCERWDEPGGLQFEFRTCSPTCNSDDDCLPFDRNGPPNVITHNTCHRGYCRNLQSLFFPLTCLRDGDHCENDTEPSDGLECQDLTGGGDMGSPPPGCGDFDPATMGLGAFGGHALTCTHECQQRSDCDRMSMQLHVLLGCRATAVGKRCLPILPFGTACEHDGDCFDKLSCVDRGALGKQCAQTCTSADDCIANPLVGSSFSCSDGLCTPKIQAGCAAPSADRCLGGMLDLLGRCVSPAGWSCGNDDQCASRDCHAGRCQ